MSGNIIHTKNRDRARSARNRENVIQRSPLHAMRHAFTGQTFVMTAEDFEAYQRLTESFVDELKPQGFLEQNFVQFLIDTSWRLNRIPALERSLLTIVIPATRCEQARALTALGMHALRLSSQFERTLRQLHEFQSKRRHPTENKSLTKSGFVFSNDVPRSSYPC
jgi:hypothetical protein